jgi:ketosteroid isomerase-like protein
MTAENVALVQSVYDNFAKGDIPAVLAALAAEVEWVESPDRYLPHHGVHRSPGEIADRVFGMVAANFDEFAVVPEHLHDAGEVVVVEGRTVGKTRHGRVLDARTCWVWTVRDGRIIANHNYHDTDAWRVALSANQ